MSGKDFKIVLAGAFGSGRSTFAKSITQARNDCKKIPTLKNDIYPVELQTSAGHVTLKLNDSQLHAKGGLPDREFFRGSDACLLFYDITKQSSYDALEEWYTAFLDANARKGSAPCPVFVVGSKIDLISERAVKPAELEFARVKKLPYLEISSKANWKTKELLLGMVRALCGNGIQLTGPLEFGEKEKEVDEVAAGKAMKEYAESGK